MTQTQTRTGGGTLALFVALVVGAGFIYGYVKKGGSDDNPEATFTVTFDRNPTGYRNTNRTFVDIEILVDRTPFVADKTIIPPWTRVVPLRRGQTAVLTATQTADGNLACAVNGDTQETTTFKGSVTCVHTRV